MRECYTTPRRLSAPRAIYTQSVADLAVQVASTRKVSTPEHPRLTLFKPVYSFCKLSFRDLDPTCLHDVMLTIPPQVRVQWATIEGAL